MSKNLNRLFEKLLEFGNFYDLPKDTRDAIDKIELSDKRYNEIIDKIAGESYRRYDNNFIVKVILSDLCRGSGENVDNFIITNGNSNYPIGVFSVNYKNIYIKKTIDLLLSKYIKGNTRFKNKIVDDNYNEIVELVKNNYDEGQQERVVNDFKLFSFDDRPLPSLAKDVIGKIKELFDKYDYIKWGAWVRNERVVRMYDTMIQRWNGFSHFANKGENITYVLIKGISELKGTA